MARRVHLITSPIPSVEEVAEMLGVPSSRVKRLQRLIGIAEPKKTGTAPKGNRFVAGKKATAKKSAVKAAKKR